eukprot:Tbor_TRINITY_DN6170_c0_g2::TRINITY_DN6170_c0_g2_i1::g.22296::m.22296
MYIGSVFVILYMEHILITYICTPIYTIYTMLDLCVSKALRSVHHHISNVDRACVCDSLVLLVLVRFGSGGNGVESCAATSGKGSVFGEVYITYTEVPIILRYKQYSHHGASRHHL